MPTQKRLKEPVTFSSKLNVYFLDHIYQIILIELLIILPFFIYDLIATINVLLSGSANLLSSLDRGMWNTTRGNFVAAQLSYDAIGIYCIYLYIRMFRKKDFGKLPDSPILLFSFVALLIVAIILFLDGTLIQNLPWIQVRK